MSITAATSSTNRITKNGTVARTRFASGKAFVSSSSTWYQGDLLVFKSNILQVPGGSGDAQYFAGIADNQVKSGILSGPYDGLTAVDGAQVTPDFVGPLYGVEADMILHTGGNFTMGCKVYMSDGDTTQTVTPTDPGDHNYIGIFTDPLGAVSSAAAGQTGRCLIGCRYPWATGSELDF